jgi:hypothetical protein
MFQGSLTRASRVRLLTFTRSLTRSKRAASRHNHLHHEAARNCLPVQIPTACDPTSGLYVLTDNCFAVRTIRSMESTSSLVRCPSATLLSGLPQTHMALKNGETMAKYTLRKRENEHTKTLNTLGGLDADKIAIIRTATRQRVPLIYTSEVRRDGRATLGPFTRPTYRLALDRELFLVRFTMYRRASLGRRRA